MHYTADCRYQCPRHTKTMKGPAAMATVVESSYASSPTSSGHCSPVSSWFERRGNRPARASANSYCIGSHPSIIPEDEGRCNKPNRRLKPWWTGNRLLMGVTASNETGRKVVLRFSRCFHQCSRFLGVSSLLCYQLVYESRSCRGRASARFSFAVSGHF